MSAVRVCQITDCQCSRGCGEGSCALEPARRRPPAFEPGWHEPQNYEQALAVVTYWGTSASYTFSARRAKKCADIFAYARGVWVDERITKDHQIAAIVNDLTSIAKKYASSQQLRERIADVIVPHLSELVELRHRMEGLEK